MIESQALIHEMTKLMRQEIEHCGINRNALEFHTAITDITVGKPEYESCFQNDDT